MPESVIESHRRRVLAPSFALLGVCLAATAFGSPTPAHRTPQPLDIGLEPLVGSANTITRTTDGMVWIGTNQGLIRHDGRQAVRFDRRSYPTLASDVITHLAAGPGGSLWVGTDGGGLARFDGIGFRAVSQPTSVGGTWTVTALLTSSDGPLFIGTPDALLSLAWGANSSSHGLPGVRVTALEEDDSGQIWAAAGSSLFRRAQSVFQPIPLPLGFPSAPIADVEVIGSDQVWVAREDGLVRLEGDFRGLGLPRSAEHVSGFDAPVCCLTADRDDTLWAASGSSLYRLDASGDRTVFDVEAPITRLFLDRSDDLWITTDGAGIVLLAGSTTTTEAPTCTLLGLRVDGRPWSLLSPRTFDPVEVIEIDVAAPTFRDPESIRVAWRLGDQPWTAVDGPIVLRDLPAGRHLVEVVAHRGSTAGTTLEIDLEIRPRLFETLPFWVAGGTLVLALLGTWTWLNRRRRRLDAWMAEQEAAERADLEILDDSAVTLGPRRVEARPPSDGDGS
ncbi:MAG: hypothetical protein AAGE94_07225 [Acidobacteriota bacterium]